MVLIDRKKLDEQIRESFKESPAVMGMLLHWIRKQKAVDAAPVVHGEWEVVAWVEPDYHSYGTIKKPNAAIRCKNCCHAFKKELIWEANYCPNCGAKMDGGSE